ncbi:MAG: hypothetical protein AB7G93_15265 [Bdellovibrionales bacterium]
MSEWKTILDSMRIEFSISRHTLQSEEDRDVESYITDVSLEAYTVDEAGIEGLVGKINARILDLESARDHDQLIWEICDSQDSQLAAMYESVFQIDTDPEDFDEPIREDIRKDLWDSEPETLMAVDHTEIIDSSLWLTPIPAVMFWHLINHFRNQTSVFVVDTEPMQKIEGVLKYVPDSDPRSLFRFLMRKLLFKSIPKTEHMYLTKYMGFPLDIRRVLTNERAKEQRNGTDQPATSGLSGDKIEGIIDAYKQNMGDDYEEIRPVLRETLTVGQLRERLKGENPALPVKVQIVKEVDGSSWSADDAFAIDAFNAYASEHEQYFILDGCVPSVIEQYKKLLNDDEENDEAPPPVHPITADLPP